MKHLIWIITILLLVGCFPKVESVEAEPEIKEQVVMPEKTTTRRLKWPKRKGK